MHDRLRVGVIFGGRSREREVSFAGGRTVYDSIDRDIFEPIPIFVDGHNNFILLNCEFLYRGTIRDFYPTCAMKSHLPDDISIYDDSLDDPDYSCLGNVGKLLMIEDLKKTIDVAFLILHGIDGEDGNIQGLLKFIGIPYTGSRVLGSAMGINKVFQKELMSRYGYDVNKYKAINIHDWNKNPEHIINDVFEEYHVPFIVKSATQGSSIGVFKIDSTNKQYLHNSINSSFGQLVINKNNWDNICHDAKKQLTIDQIDYRYGIGYPVIIDNTTIYSPLDLLGHIDKYLLNHDQCLITSCNHCEQVIVEEYMCGREFSCVVLRNKNNKPVALPPTEIINTIDIFNYRDKYLPGAITKRTPIEVTHDIIDSIRETCVQVFSDLHFDVYARIDGFLTDDNRIIINDPNTLSGMEPSSFVFQQAAEIGLTNTELITFIIDNSLRLYRTR